MLKAKGFHVHASNRLEFLAAQLAGIIQRPLSSPLASEVIVVQSRGMERWVSMQLAAHNRICANIRYSFPNTFLHEAFQKLLADVPDTTLFDPDILTFRIMKLLPENVTQPEFESLRLYLKEDPSGLKLYQLSEKVADIFDQYLVFRPEMVFAWEAGKGAHWQAALWRQLTEKVDHLHHRAGLRKQFLEKIRTSTPAMAKFPERISIFGISHLPDFHIQVFAELSRYIPVNLFLMNPCKEFWGDIVSGQDSKRIRRKYQGTGVAETDLHLKSGNPLLASMGGLGRDFLNIIFDHDCEFHEQYDDIQELSLLTSVQSDILTLTDRNEFNDEAYHGLLFQPGEDRSIRIHSCHSPMREIEVLHDNLLSMFEELPGLLPKDIIVMTPDIETYSPFVQAVFGAQTRDELRIPFTIADRNIRIESRIADAFAALLDFKASRFGSSQVLSLLEVGSIRKKFNISESDLRTIEHWIQETGIRWGIDAKNRERLDLPDFKENTWKAGIERLLLGYAMRGGDNKMFADILPYDPMEGSDVKILGRFIEFIERMIHWVKLMEQDDSLSEWSRTLHTQLDQLFHSDEDSEREIQLLRTLFDGMTNNQALSGYTESVSLEVVRSYMLHHLGKEGFGSGFISGGVTFCAMLPMRSIPFEVVCLVGMNSDAFPRESRHLEIDLVSKYPKPGDRSRRNDDRYLFLESILSARKKIYISYVGQSIKDASIMPPSVLVSELMDYLAEGFGLKDADLVTRHRLQAFSPEYFKKSREDLVSYSEENMLASTSLLGPKENVAFITKGLSPPDDEWKQINPGQLKRFFTHPARHLLQQRLRIYYDKGGSVLEDRENFRLDPLDRYIIGQELVEQGLKGVDPDELLPVYRASGMLPHGSVGETQFRELCLDVDEFVNSIRTVKGESQEESIEVDLSVETYRIHGELNYFHKDRGLIRYRFVNMKPKDLLSSWIDHLLLCSMGDIPHQKKTVLICRDAAWEFCPVNESESILKDLLSRYWEGLSKPLPFFPESAYRYASDILQKQKTEDDALRSARNQWRGSDFNRGESEDPYFRRCFGTTDPLDDLFETLSLEIFEPVFENLSRFKIL
ncbi:MAG TPA: exodeoxyribonuclease V subunit gamma [Deltaproteobacteria bacterium]|nr:exodeoxyribonuclease V subunit gamma [Deltaproteobacteria bacterium]